MLVGLIPIVAEMIYLDSRRLDRQPLTQADLTQDWDDRLVDTTLEAQPRIVAKEPRFPVARITGFRSKADIAGDRSRCQIIAKDTTVRQFQSFIGVDVKHPVTGSCVKTEI